MGYFEVTTDNDPLQFQPLPGITAVPPRITRKPRRDFKIAGLAGLVTLLGATACGPQSGFDATHLEPADANMGHGKPTIEVMHWLSTGAEASAMAVIRARFNRDGGHWRESVLPSVAAANSTVMNRLLGGAGPDIFQVSVGLRLQELARNGLVRPIPLDARELDSVLPEVIARAAKRNSQYIAVPVDIMGENWMFYNQAVLAKAGLDVPRTWQDVLRASAILSTAGKTPIALGGQPWQERILFNSVLLGVGGRRFYRRVYERMDAAALESPEMLQTFAIFGALRKYVDSGSPGRPWNLATGMLIRGDAAFQFTGDWAKGELRAAGIEPGHGIGCSLAPSPDLAYIMAADAFAMSTSAQASPLPGQLLFMRTALNPQVQAEFNRVRGSIPARLDISEIGFDGCAQLAMKVIRDPDAQLVSTGLFGLSGAMSGAIDDAVSQFWNDPRMSAEQGRRLFIDTVGAFR